MTPLVRWILCPYLYTPHGIYNVPVQYVYTCVRAVSSSIAIRALSIIYASTRHVKKRVLVRDTPILCKLRNVYKISTGYDITCVNWLLQQPRPIVRPLLYRSLHAPLWYNNVVYLHGRMGTLSLRADCLVVAREHVKPSVTRPE
jgi:hypothetical protein